MDNIRVSSSDFQSRWNNFGKGQIQFDSEIPTHQNALRSFVFVAVFWDAKIFKDNEFHRFVVKKKLDRSNESKFDPETA